MLNFFEHQHRDKIFQIMLDKLAGITSLAVSKPMMAVLLKLFGYCVKLGSNRQLLLSPEMGTTPVLLNTLKLCLAAGETLMTTGEMSSTIWEPGVRSSDMCNLRSCWDLLLYNF